MEAKGTLTAPLKAFFGIPHETSGRKRRIAVATVDKQVNIDQVRVIFNSCREPITYVEGPPGTGKTQTLLNVVLSLFFEQKSCLICSANNLPIDDIHRKLLHSLPFNPKGTVLFPVLRIGNTEVLKKSLKELKSLYQQALALPPPNETITQSQCLFFKQKTQHLSELLNSYEERLRLQEQIQTLKRWRSYAPDTSGLLLSLNRRMEELSRQLNALPKISNETVQSLCLIGSETVPFSNFLYYHSLLRLQKLSQARFNELTALFSMEDEAEAVQSFKDYLKDDTHIRELTEVFPVWISTCLSSSKIGSPSPHFDLCIMDESGQCDIARALASMVRCNRLLLVGDTQQLRPVILLDDSKQRYFQKLHHVTPTEIYDFVHSSILGLMQRLDPHSKKIMLRYHYRCAASIIHFSNEVYYRNRLKPENPDPGTLQWIDVRNSGGPKRNCYEAESEAVVRFLASKPIGNQTVAIITPFRNQAQLINQKLKEQSITHAFAGTIHKVQGSEYDTVIFSTALSRSSSPKTFDWVKNNSELINVACTRAKKELICVGDGSAIDRLSAGSPNVLASLKEYVQTAAPDRPVPVFPAPGAALTKDNNSESEKIFFSTLTQVLSTTSHCRLKRNVPMKSLSPDTRLFSDYYQKSEFDVVLFRKEGEEEKAVLIIELDGDEHYANPETIARDEKKERLCKEQQIKLFRIPNHFAAHYQFLKGLITQLPLNLMQGNLFE